MAIVGACFLLGVDESSRLARLRASPEKHGTPAYEALYGDPFAPDYDSQAGAGCNGQARAQLGDPIAYAN